MHAPLTFTYDVSWLKFALSATACIVHAFVCSRIGYYNYNLIDLPDVYLSSIQPALNADARLIARLSKYIHISLFIAQLAGAASSSLSARIQFKGRALVLKYKLSFAQKCLSVVIRPPLSTFSHSLYGKFFSLFCVKLSFLYCCLHLSLLSRSFCLSCFLSLSV